MNLRRLWAILRKEFLHIVRDTRTVVIVFIMPLMQMLLMGYTVLSDIKNIPIAICDLSQSVTSRDFVAAFRTTDVFDIDAFVYAITHSAVEFLAEYPDSNYLNCDTNCDEAVDIFDHDSHELALGGTAVGTRCRRAARPAASDQACYLTHIRRIKTLLVELLCRSNFCISTASHTIPFNDIIQTLREL